MSNPFELPDDLLDAVRESQRVLTPETLRRLEAEMPSAQQLASMSDILKTASAIAPDVISFSESIRKALPSRDFVTLELSRAVHHQLDVFRNSTVSSIQRDLATSHSLLSNAFDEPRRAMLANFAALSDSLREYTDVASRSIAADVRALALQPIGALYGLDTFSATVLGLRTASFVDKSKGTAGLPRKAAALQVRAVRTLSTDEAATSAPTLVDDAKAETADRLPAVLLTLGLLDAHTALQELRAVSPADLAKGGTIARRGWIVQQRTLIEDLVKRATPEIPRRQQALTARFRALKASGHPQAVTIEKDWSALEQLLNSLHASAHELLVPFAEPTFEVIAARSEVFLQILADILLSSSGN